MHDEHGDAVPRRSTLALGRMHRWRNWFWMIALAAVGPTFLYASPWGPARNIEAAARWLLLYPAWLLLSIVWLVPGILLATRARSPFFWLIIPIVAELVEVTRSGITHWPPSYWWPNIVIGGTPQPSGYLFGYGVEAWEGYMFSLRPGCIEALAAALLLVAVNKVHPNIAFERTRRE
jgi:hypothetical protein